MTSTFAATAPPDATTTTNRRRRPLFLSREDVLACRFSSWYKNFISLKGTTRKRVTIKSIIIPLSQDFINYLLHDGGVQLPIEATRVSSILPSRNVNEEEEDWDESNDDNDGDSASQDNKQPSTITWSFPELTQAIEAAIEELGDSVIPKLNWSSPKDATWVNGGSLKCQTAGDVYLLLKSSDFVLHDLVHAFDNCTTTNTDNDDHEESSTTSTTMSYELVLRQWCNLSKSMEYRCFVFHSQLVAISQRDYTQHFAHVVKDRLMIRSYIVDFYHDHVQPNFTTSSTTAANTNDNDTYVFDVYIDKKQRVWLLDFNVWGSQTDSLLFDWHELEQEDLLSSSDDIIAPSDDDDVLPVIRVVETENEIHHDPLASYRAPIDTVDLATMTQSDSTKFEEFMALCRRNNDNDDDDEDDDG